MKRIRSGNRAIPSSARRASPPEPFLPGAAPLSATAAGPCRARRTGSVLILALWTLYLLGVLALAVGAHVSAGMRLAGELKRDTVAYHLARAGVQRVASELSANSNSWDGCAAEVWMADSPLLEPVALGQGEFEVTYEFPGQPEVRPGVIGEEARVNLNRAESNLVAALLVTAGELSPGMAAEVAAAVLDGRDGDDGMLTGRSESDYYADSGQSNAGRQDGYGSVYELCLVQGVTDELFAKLEPHVTVHGSGRINLNAAGEVVLSALVRAAGSGGGSAAGESLVQKIISFRQAGHGFGEPTEGAMLDALQEFSELEEGERSLFSRALANATIRSSCFRGTATGRLAQGGASSRIEFVWDRDRGKRVHWHEY